MTLTLKLRFHTVFGQSLWVCGNHPALGSDDPARAVPMEYQAGGTWRVTIPIDRKSLKKPITYHYLLREPDGSTVADWGEGRALDPALFDREDIVVLDSWNAPGYSQNAFYTRPFHDVLLRDNRTPFSRPAPATATHVFRVRAPLLARGQTLCLLGDTSALANWDTTKPVLLNRDTDGSDPDVPETAKGTLEVQLDLGYASVPIEYKYGVFDLQQNAFVTWEAGPNRILPEGGLPDRRVIVDDGFVRLPAETWRGAGVAIPVFSLRSSRSFGAGEFADLKLLGDWCRQTGLKLIQILPVNDTTSTHTWSDSYPYAAISAFALHPIYLSLDDVVNRANRSRLKRLEPERRRLNALPEIDYEAVMRAKLAFVKEVFPSQKQATFRRREYKQFFTENRHWLVPYAVFCCLRDRYGTANPDEWPEHRRCTREGIATLAADPTCAEAIELHYFIQFHLHKQLQSAAAHLHERGVVLKGDIAIGVARHGADTWQAPELYHLDLQAGAPPDPFAEKGQNWGFPTYNWPRMMGDDFAWWKRRFTQMSHYFDAFRIDHILGFFRIWSIPMHAVEGILGRFVPALPVKPEEFAARGIPFDRERYVEPYITDAVLAERFGAEASKVREAYLMPPRNGRYALRPEFATQRQVERHFAGCESDPAEKKLKEGLFDLISNVLLFEVEGDSGPEYHFRFHMEKTASFRALNGDTQARLRDLYVDYFFRRQDAFWRGEAMQKLPALKRVTNMLICGEDLGLVPACVPGVMRELGLLSLEIQRMPKALGRAFSRPSEAPYLSVVTPSTHDMSTIRGWWEEDPQLTQRFYNEELGRPGVVPRVCTGELNEAVVRQHLASPAMWSIFQLQDLLGMDEALRREDAHAERINVPANPKHYWRYRMHLTLEELIAAEQFNRRLGALLLEYGR
ncbi:MAG TPA: 4-alpha-glucanotransferase [Verrucomicrobia bacterium]|nr:4-alpha-glucanotransferase [Verrucomicrobiota bacterium]